MSAGVQIGATSTEMLLGTLLGFELIESQGDELGSTLGLPLPSLGLALGTLLGVNLGT